MLRKLSYIVIRWCAVDKNVYQIRRKKCNSQSSCRIELKLPSVFLDLKTRVSSIPNVQLSYNSV